MSPAAPTPSLTAATVELLACETCGSAERASHGSTRGERLLRELHKLPAEAAQAGVTVSAVRCLWACKRSCSVHLRAAGRAGYVLVDLEPNEVSARALLQYATMYGESSDGAVPFKRWPDALRGHFLCRTPPVTQAAPAPLESDATRDKDRP